MNKTTSHVVLKTFQSRFEAEIARGVLESHGIHAFIMADEGGSGGAVGYVLFAAGFVKLMVNNSDVDKARLILEERVTSRE